MSDVGNVEVNIWWDTSMPVGFGPCRINPHIIKNSLADRRLVLSVFGYTGDNLAAQGHLKGEKSSPGK